MGLPKLHTIRPLIVKSVLINAQQTSIFQASFIIYKIFSTLSYKQAVLSHGNRAMPQLFFSV